jgi:hypothetical protein
MTFKFRETPELIKRAILSQILFSTNKGSKNENKDRCRDSTEAVLTNGVGRIGREIFPSKIQKG